MHARPSGQLDPPHVGAYAGQDTLKLNSKPGATKVLFMDMGVLTLDKAEIWKAWQTVAGAYSAFNVNVTTEKAVYDAAGVTNSGKGCYNNATGRSSCSLNAFGTTRCCTIYNKGNGYYQGATSAHELGHLMGLSHDGGEPGGEYFSGYPAFNGARSWGATFPRPIGAIRRSFSGAKANTRAPRRSRTISRSSPRTCPPVPTTSRAARSLAIQTGDVSSDINRGQIASNTDTDTFTFRIGSMGGHATLNIDRLEFVGGAYLDVDAQLLDGAGAKIAQSNEKVARNAKFDVDLMPGDYQLVIAGGAEGTPANGFSSYSSLGYYGISGKITGAIDTGARAARRGAGGAAAAAGTGGAAGAGGAAGDAGAAGYAGKAGGGGAGAGGAAGSAGSGGSAGRRWSGWHRGGKMEAAAKPGTGGVGDRRRVGGRRRRGGGGAGAGGGKAGSGGQAGTGIATPEKSIQEAAARAAQELPEDRQGPEERRAAPEQEPLPNRKPAVAAASRLADKPHRPGGAVALLGGLGRLRESRRKRRSRRKVAAEKSA